MKKIFIGYFYNSSAHQLVMVVYEVEAGCYIIAEGFFLYYNFS